MGGLIMLPRARWASANRYRRVILIGVPLAAILAGAVVFWDYVWIFISAHWAIIAGLGVPIGALAGAAIPAYLTYRGWAVTFKNNSELEQARHINAISLEKRKA